MSETAAKLGAESMIKTFAKFSLMAALCAALSNCGAFRSNDGPVGRAQEDAAKDNPSASKLEIALGEDGGEAISIFDALRSPDQNTNVRVNKYLWNASLETLRFLPVESADPFTGVLVMGWGRAPGSSRQYRATVLVQDPALDARSLKVSVHTRGGVASAETVRRIEDAILTRARQLRVRDKNL